MHTLEIPGQSIRRSNRHVGERHLIGRYRGGELKGSLAVRLVPARDETASVRILELGEQCARVAVRRSVIEREQARGLLVNPAVVRQPQRMGTDGELVVPPERHGLQLRVIANPRRCTLAGERRAVDDDIGAVEYDLVRGPMHADINRHRGLERERAGVPG
jgi:hypothetical protein